MDETVCAYDYMANGDNTRFLGRILGRIFSHQKVLPMLKLFEIQKARAKDKPYKLVRWRGLHLLVETNGRKAWRFRYQFDGRRR